MIRTVRALVLSVLTLLAVVVPAGSATAAPIPWVPANSFGIHSWQGSPQLPKGSFRLACGPGWDRMNPAPGVYDWAEMDDLVAGIRSWGYDDVLFSFCHTPRWAATSARQPLPADYQRQALPPKLSAWRAFVNAFVTRYAGDFSGYEVWNEATSESWWLGDTKQLVAMTTTVRSVVTARDRTAAVVSASLQCCTRLHRWRGVAVPYVTALRKARWPVNALAYHTYPGTNLERTSARMLSERARTLAFVTGHARAQRVPQRVQLWDTETNYLPRGTTATEQRAIVTRTFLDSWRYGVRRTYWYLWTTRFYDWVGIQTMPGSAAAEAYARLADWTTGASITGCRRSAKLVVCGFAQGGTSFQIAYAETPPRAGTLRLGRARPVCTLDGACTTRTGTLRIGTEPVRIG